MASGEQSTEARQAALDAYLRERGIHDYIGARREIDRLRRIETLARAAVQPNGRMMSVDTNALKALMEAAHACT